MSTKNNIFRKASLDQVSSPDQLNDYIRISRPSVWLILGAVATLLVGALVWGVFGTLTTTIHAVAIISEGTSTCYLPAKKVDDLAVGMSVQVIDSTGIVVDVSATPMEIAADFDPYALYLGEFQKGDFLVSASIDINMPDGVYPASIIVERIAPISFILN